MTSRSDIDLYLSQVERYAGKKFRYRSEIGMVMECARSGSMSSGFERLIFLAKFITRGFDILRRSGVVADETKNLADEIERNLSEVSDLLKKLSAVQPSDQTGHFDDRFLTLSGDSLIRLKELLSELTWLKNYALEGHPFPVIPGSS